MSTEAKIDEKIEISIEPPKLWKVILLNDDKTPMEFVIELLMSVFKHDEKLAKDTTLEVHNTGSGVAGVYSFEIAEHRAIEATNISRVNGWPLQIQVIEE